jgi:hypothetical protein
MAKRHVGPLEYVGDLGAAAALVDQAWSLVGDAFAEQQTREFAQALAENRRPRQRLHPWIPGLHWHRTHLATGYVGALPPAVLYVVQDMLALHRVPDLLPRYTRQVVRRLKRERERALWELRVAAQYAPAGIRAEWSAITDPSPGAPDVHVPTFNAEIQVKCLDPREDIATDYKAIFGALDDAWSQLDRRRERGSEGPGAIVVVLPGASSLSAWDGSEVFRASMSMRLGMPEYQIVSAMVFVIEPVVELRADGHQLYGAPASHILNPMASHPWPDALPLVVNG